MNIHPFRPAMPSRRWLLALAWAGLAALAGGCATQPGGDIPPELQTASDESDARKRARTRLALAAGYYENGQHMVALDEQKRALQADPNYPDAYNLGGLIYMALGDNALAISNFQRAIALNPRDGNAMHNLGWLQCQQQRFAEAEQSFAQALRSPAYATPARTWMVQGICQARAGQAAVAIQSLTRAFELDPAQPVTLYNLALLHHQRNESERARFYLRRLNQTEFANAESLWLAIRIENRLQNREAAQQLARQLLRRFPDSRQANAYERGAFNE